MPSMQLTSQKDRPLTKGQVEYWTKRSNDQFDDRKSDLKAQFESTIQINTDKKWKSFLKSLNVNHLIKKCEIADKNYQTFKDDKEKVERELERKRDIAFDDLRERIKRFGKIRKWQDDYTEKDTVEGVVQYLKQCCYDECEKQFNNTKQAKPLDDIEDARKKVEDFLNMSNVSTALLGLIKYQFQQVGIKSNGLLDSNIKELKQIT